MSKMPGEHDPLVSDDNSSQSSATYLIASMADTTWRMFVPTVGLLLVGNWLDGLYGSKPWLLLIGAFVGACISAYLIKRQLEKGKRK